MKFWRIFLPVSLLAGAIAGRSDRAYALGYGDSQPRSMGMARAYGALARGVESLYWNPANLALSDSPEFSLPLVLGVSFIGENNSISVNDYNHYNGEFIDQSDKEKILRKIDENGLRFNAEIGFPPLLSGICFPLPGGVRSAVAFDVSTGVEGEMPRDMVDLLLYGNEFARDRIAQGKDPEYNIAEWEGSAWGLGILSWGFAKSWLPARLQSRFAEFAVGATVKIMGGGYGEVLRSDGGVITRVSGAQVDAHAVTRRGGGRGVGVDLGVVGITTDRRTAISAALVNFFDHLSWNGAWNLDARQDSFFVKGQRLGILSFTGKEDIAEVFDNPRDEEGDVVFHEEEEISGFSRSLPALLRIGVSYQRDPHLILTGNYDQAFSRGFGISPVPRLAAGLEYRLVDWFPMRCGLSVGGRAGMSSAVGFGFGPLGPGKVQISLLETALVNRGGFLPGLAKGVGLSVNLFELSLKSD